jgi:putative membrane protein
MKILPYFLVAGALALNTACSSTSTDATGSNNATAGSGDTRMGTDMNPTPAPDANAGATPGGATSSGTAGSTATGGTGGPTDMTAFMGTFATMEDPTFLLTAASSNLLEIQTGQLASQQATNADVKKFAQMMVSHHTKATQQLQSVATPLGVTMPQAMMPVHQAMADQLANKTGKGFDEAYMDLMETAHKMDIAMFEVKSKSAQTPAVKTFATNTLPMLRSHATLANNVEKKVD